MIYRQRLVTACGRSMAGYGCFSSKTVMPLVENVPCFKVISDLYLSFVYNLWSEFMLTASTFKARILRWSKALCIY